MISKWHQQDERHERIKQAQIIASEILTLDCGECKLTKMTHHFSLDKSRKLGFSLDVRLVRELRIRVKLRLNCSVIFNHAYMRK